MPLFTAMLILLLLSWRRQASKLVPDFGKPPKFVRYSTRDTLK